MDENKVTPNRSTTPPKQKDSNPGTINNKGSIYQDKKSISPRNKKIGTYAFAQQTGSACHVFPSINYQKLQEMEHREGHFKMEAMDYRSKREHLAETRPAVIAWGNAIKQLTSSEGPFKQHMLRLKQNGITMPHLYEDKNAQEPYVDTTDSGLIPNFEHMKRIFWTPTNFFDVSALQATDIVYTPIPLSMDANNQLWCYDADAQKYTQAPIIRSFTQPIFEDNICSYTDSNFNRVQAPTMEDRIPVAIMLPNIINPNTQERGISEWAVVYLSKGQESTIGSIDFTKLEEYYFSNNTSHGISGLQCQYQYLPTESLRSAFYMVSLYQLILLGVGVDNHNNTIEESHALWPVYQEFKTAMAEDPNNPWGQPHFKKENIFEYQLTQLIKDNPELKKEIEQVVSFFFDCMQYYKKLDDLYDENGNSIKDKKENLPDEDQLLSFYFSQGLRWLWASAVSKNGFYGELELNEPFLRQLFDLTPGVFGPNHYRREAHEQQGDISLIDKIQSVLGIKEDNRPTFITVWKKIRNMLADKTGGKEDFISFSGHGVVMSFNPEVTALQNSKETIVDPKTLDELGFAIIESSYAADIQPFYREDQIIDES